MKCNKCIQNKCEDCGEVIPVWNATVWPNNIGTAYPPYKAEQTGTFDPCFHSNCTGCKNGTCSGVHMISCPCKKCSPFC